MQYPIALFLSDPNAWPEEVEGVVLSTDSIRVTWADPYDVAEQNDDITGYKVM